MQFNFHKQKDFYSSHFPFRYAETPVIIDWSFMGALLCMITKSNFNLIFL